MGCERCEQGHDEDISFEDVKNLIGSELANSLKDKTLDMYIKARDYLFKHDIILCDTKFEFGLNDDGEAILIDEILTPDSSRFWPKQTYSPGKSPESFDKQYVRDFLINSGWDKVSPLPMIPPDVISNTIAKYKTVEKIIRQI